MIKRDKLKTLLIGFSLTVTTVAAYLLQHKISERNVKTEKLKSLPEFGIEEVLMKKIFTDNQLRAKDFKYIIFFNTECDHCLQEIKEIENGIKAFGNSMFLFISNEEEEKLQRFAASLNFNAFPFLLGRDADLKINNLFDVKGLPSIYIYNNKNALIRKFVGEIKIQKLIQPW